MVSLLNSKSKIAALSVIVVAIVTVIVVVSRGGKPETASESLPAQKPSVGEEKMAIETYSQIEVNSLFAEIEPDFEKFIESLKFI